LPRVLVSQLSAAHLISYRADRDILPLVLANCSYSFEVGKGTKVEYDFSNFERQLVDRFFSGRAFVDAGEVRTWPGLGSKKNH
jgi:hypothetical protein